MKLFSAVKLTVLPIALLSTHASLTYAAQPESYATREAPEEIVITGDATFRERLMAAEKRAYDIFNQFNDEERFEISCNVQKRTGSIFTVQLCMPAFKLDALQKQAEDFKVSLGNFLLDPSIAMPDGSVVPSHAPAEALIAAQTPDFQRKLKEVAEQHPEFLDALIDYSELREQQKKPK